METRFSKQISTKLSADKLWRDILAGIKNSNGHPFWPEDLEESHSPILKKNGVINVNYKKLGIKGKPVTYLITDCNNQRHHFAYMTTANHPMEGHADISVDDNGDGGSTLVWKGVYRYPWYSPSGFFLRTFFLNKFFSELRESIHEYENH